MKNQVQQPSAKFKPAKTDQNPNILDSRFEYVHSSKTSVQKTWEKFGFKPIWGNK